MSLKFDFPKGPIDNNAALIQIMAWHRTDDKPLSERLTALFIDAYMWQSASMNRQPEIYSWYQKTRFS